MSRAGIHKFPGGGESGEGCAASASLPIDSIGQRPMPQPSRSVKLESAHAKNKERCRKDRERPSLDGEKTHPPDSRMDVQLSPCPLCGPTAVFRQVCRANGDRSEARRLGY